MLSVVIGNIIGAFADIEVPGIKVNLNDAQCFTESLEVYDLTLSQESDWVTDFLIMNQM